jgi:hypothetical protein
MEKLFYVSSTKINAKIADTVIDGQHIEMEGYTYQRVSRRPLGRRVLRRLLNEQKQEQIVIYS